MEAKRSSVQLFTGYTDVYYMTRDAREFIVVNQGGSSSSKTYSIMQYLCHKAIESKVDIDIVAESYPVINRGALRDLKALIDDSPILRECLENAKLVKGPFVFKNGSVITFVVAPTQQTAKSGKRDYLFINEANGIDYNIAFEFIARTRKKVLIDYNPNAAFWVHREYIGKPDVKLIISNFTHNQFLPENIKNQILTWRQNWLTTRSTFWKNKWFVYGLGKTGVTEGAIFEDIMPTTFFPLYAKKITYGLDFGFKNNHTALVKLGIYNKALYGKELLYQQKLNSFQLVDILKNIGINENDRIVADPANDEAITILQSKGFNVVPAKKGNDSIKAGIELLQSVPFYVTADSKNWWHEVENYKYRQDRDGRWTNTPVDDYNDCFDAARYAATDMLGVRIKKSSKTGRKKYSRKIIAT